MKLFISNCIKTRNANSDLYNLKGHLLIFVFFLSYFITFYLNALPPVQPRRTFIDNFFEDKFKFGFNLISQIPVPPGFGALKFIYFSYAFGFDIFAEYRYRDNKVGTRLNISYLASPGKPKDIDAYKHIMTFDPHLRFYPGPKRNFFVAQGFYIALPLQVVGTGDDPYGKMSRYAIGFLFGLGSETRRGITIGLNAKLFSFNRMISNIHFSSYDLRMLGGRFSSYEFYVGWNMAKLFTYDIMVKPRT